MSFFKQTAVYIFKREAYRGFRRVNNNIASGKANGFFFWFGAIFGGFLLVAWILNDGLPTICEILAMLCLMMAVRYYIYSTKKTVSTAIFEIPGYDVKNFNESSYSKALRGVNLNAAKMWSVWFIVFFALMYLTQLIPKGYLSTEFDKLDSLFPKHVSR